MFSENIHLVKAVSCIPPHDPDPSSIEIFRDFSHSITEFKLRSLKNIEFPLEIQNSLVLLETQTLDLDEIRNILDCGQNSNSKKSFPKLKTISFASKSKCIEFSHYEKFFSKFTRDDSLLDKIDLIIKSRPKTYSSVVIKPHSAI